MRIQANRIPKKKLRHALMEIPSGDYSVTLAKVDVNRATGVIQLEFAMHDDAAVELYAGSGIEKYWVFDTKTKSYTAMGARNIHHAANKATKLWQGRWDGITRKKLRDINGWQYKSVKEFGVIMKLKK